jgi:hypothetical protein
VRGAGPDADLLWRARVRDDDGFVWRSVAQSPAALAMKWSSKSPSRVAALVSLRPVSLEVRVEAPDGRAASRTFTRRLLADSVKVRRWRDLSATLLLPESPRRTVVVAADDDAARIAAALLASHGALVLLAPGGLSPEMAERLSQVSGAGEAQVVDRLPLPPGVPAVAGAISGEIDVFRE